MNQYNLEHLYRQALEAETNENYAAARLIYRQILDEDKRRTDAWLGLARLEKHEKKDKDWEKRMERYIRQVLQIDPTDSDAQTSLDELLATRKRRERRSVMIGVTVLALMVLTLVAAVVYVLVALRS